MSIAILQNYINGELVPPATGAYLDVYNPATGQVYASAPNSDFTDVNRAVEAAQKAFPAW
jgi:aminomuconate-semialdehyde/2-hydroxymuconate-6-semialdehyde dehydrogenase